MIGIIPNWRKTWGKIKAEDMTQSFLAQGMLPISMAFNQTLTDKKTKLHWSSRCQLQHRARSWPGCASRSHPHSFSQTGKHILCQKQDGEKAAYTGWSIPLPKQAALQWNTAGFMAQWHRNRLSWLLLQGCKYLWFVLSCPRGCK